MSSKSSYSEYKNSGFSWLGQVPAHWSVVRSDLFIQVVTTQLDQSRLYGQDVFHYSIPIVQKTGTGQIEDGSHIDSSKILIDSEVILVSKLNPRKGTICLAQPQDQLTVCSTEFVPLRVRIGSNVHFVNYLVQSENNRQRLDALVTSATRSHQRVNPSDVRKFWVALPPLSEQEAIAAYLDHETTEIDSFIADQEELIGLLNERRVATITQAVTKGLDLTVQMKDSGVPWMGKVPGHWIVDKGTRIGKVFGSEMIKEDDINEVSGTQFLKVSSLSVAGFSLQPTRWFVERYAAAPVTDFIVFPKRGAAIFTNKVNIVKEPALLDPNLMGWKPYKDCDSKYFAYVLQLVKLEEIADVSTVPQINTKHIASLRLPKPPMAEQQQIVDYLDYETSEIDAAIADAREAIELSKERRAALISAVVTGKIDVRSHSTAELGAA